MLFIESEADVTLLVLGGEGAEGAEGPEGAGAGAGAPVEDWVVVVDMLGPGELGACLLRLPIGGGVEEDPNCD